MGGKEEESRESASERYKRLKEIEQEQECVSEDRRREGERERGVEKKRTGEEERKEGEKEGV